MDTPMEWFSFLLAVTAILLPMLLAAFLIELRARRSERRQGGKYEKSGDP